MSAASTSPAPPPAVRMRGVRKAFGALQALDGVDLEVRPGQVTALLGENGAGKSTLMSVLAGLVAPDAGVIELAGARARLDSPARAIAAGIGMVHQHLQLVPGFTVAENVLLGLRAPRLWLGRRTGHAALADLAARTGLAVDPAAPVWSLSVGERQRVEILKVLWRGARVLILDEPTAVLTPLEVQPFLDSVRRLADQGSAVVLISHKLREVLAVADRITVLRRGRVVAADLDARATDARALEAHILGAASAPPVERPAPPLPAAGPPIVQVQGLVAAGPRGERALDGLDLCLEAGEILGVAGVSGNGQRELAAVLLGLQPALGGRVLVDGQDVTRLGVGERRARGLGLIPEDRHGQGAAPGLSVLENLSLLAMQRPPHGWRLRWPLLRARARALVEAHDVRLRELAQAAGELSGGNLQKLILARELDARPRLLIAAQPTRGLDPGAASEVRARLVALAAAGAGVLLISEDLDEVLALSHRVLVLYRGRAAGLFAAATASVEQVGRCMLGSAEAA